MYLRTINYDGNKNNYLKKDHIDKINPDVTCAKIDC